MSDDLRSRLLNEDHNYHEAACHEAWAKIEALTAERDEAWECNEQFFVDNQFLKKRVEKAEAERDRLRDALEYILAECTLSDNTMPSLVAIKYAARAALKGETP